MEPVFARIDAHPQEQQPAYDIANSVGNIEALVSVCQSWLAAAPESQEQKERLAKAIIIVLQTPDLEISDTAFRALYSTAVVHSRKTSTVLTVSALILERIDRLAAFETDAHTTSSPVLTAIASLRAAREIPLRSDLERLQRILSRVAR